MENESHGIVPTETCQIESIQSMIRAVGGVQVMLDRDLAALYGVPVKRLNEQVKRNQDRFPSDFMFQLSKEDCLRSQIATLNGKRGEHLKYMPYAFTIFQPPPPARLSVLIKSEDHNLAFNPEISDGSSFATAKHFLPRSLSEAPIR